MIHLRWLWRFGFQAEFGAVPYGTRTFMSLRAASGLLIGMVPFSDAESATSGAMLAISSLPSESRY